MSRDDSFMVGGQTQVWFDRAWAEVLEDALVVRGVERALVLSSARGRPDAEAVCAALEDRGLGVFAQAAQHVPRALAQRGLAEAERLGADAIVAIGGGSVIGLGKAIALLRWRSGAERLCFAVLPTTYAGSEMTEIWGLGRADGVGKEVGRDAAVRPDLVIYDPALIASLPAKIAIPSLFNAMAHAVDALYPLERDDPDGELAQLAERSVTELGAAIEALAIDADDPLARREALAGAQKAGEVLDRAGMSLHHKLAHVLGGRFGLAHASTHTVLLPHVVAFMATDGAAPRARERLARALDHEDPAAALFDLQIRSGAPTQLRALGLEREQIAEACAVVLAASVDSPRPLEEGPLSELLLDAWLGHRPRAPPPSPR